MNIRVSPDLDKVVRVAKEARISIRDVHFIRNADADILEALSIAIDGSADAVGYFAFLLSKDNMMIKTAR